MKITGYQLMDRLEELKEQAQTLDTQFKAALFQFAEERGSKPEPRVLMREYAEIERKVAILQEAQSAYNLRVAVTVNGESVSLERAVKLIGSANRVKNQWKSASQEASNPYAGYGAQRQRDKENEYAERMVPAEEAIELSEAAGRQASALKRAIRAGNRGCIRQAAPSAPCSPCSALRCSCAASTGPSATSASPASAR